nr:MAG TPA: hypothetical protein [Caudoviricetes sp.]
MCYLIYTPPLIPSVEEYSFYNKADISICNQLYHLCLLASIPRTP